MFLYTSFLHTFFLVAILSECLPCLPPRSLDRYTPPHTATLLLIAKASTPINIFLAHLSETAEFFERPYAVT
ncbi:MAG: hypothetical protein HRT36_04305 [Alphaproteobacteria bacterium]|nr:hypothetical protein [Alphaproteobacteria bacterium]